MKVEEQEWLGIMLLLKQAGYLRIVDDPTSTIVRVAAMMTDIPLVSAADLEGASRPARKPEGVETLVVPPVLQQLATSQTRMDGAEEFLSNVRKLLKSGSCRIEGHRSEEKVGLSLPVIGAVRSGATSQDEVYLFPDVTVREVSRFSGSKSKWSKNKIGNALWRVGALRRFSGDRLQAQVRSLNGRPKVYVWRIRREYLLDGENPANSAELRTDIGAEVRDSPKSSVSANAGSEPEAASKRAPDKGSREMLETGGHSLTSLPGSTFSSDIG
jgi:hypothetical protein